MELLISAVKCITIGVITGVLAVIFTFTLLYMDYYTVEIIKRLKG